MREKIKLSNPILINGKTINELPYDIMEIDSSMFLKATTLADDAARQNGAPAIAPMEMDVRLHLYLGMMAIIAVDSSIDVEDLKRVKGMDVVKLTQVGRNFITVSSVESSQESNLDEPSEATLESFTRE